jgi:hypothetical protein
VNALSNSFISQLHRPRIPLGICLAAAGPRAQSCMRFLFALFRYLFGRIGSRCW